MILSRLSRGARMSLAAMAALGLSGLSSGAGADSDGFLGGFNNFDWKEFFTYHGKDDKKKPKVQPLTCPEIIILEGTAASQVHAGAPPTNANLRYQYALGEVVRECAHEGDQLSVKVGIDGKVLLGPAGEPASFSVPLRVAIVGTADGEPVVSKLYRVAATIPTGEAQTDFSLVTEPLMVPFIQNRANDDYTIKVGIDEGPEKPAPKASERTPAKPRP